jgi:hypothetical protein
MPRYEALAYLQTFGISLQQAANILNDPEGFIAAMRQARTIADQLGVDLNEATQKGRAWSNEWSRFGAVISGIWTNVFNAIEPVSEKILKALDDNVLAFGTFSHALNDVPAIVATALGAFQGIASTLGVVGGAISGIAGGPLAILKGAIGGLAESFAVIPRLAASVLGVLARFASNPVVAFLITMWPKQTQAGIGGGPHETEAGKAYQEQAPEAPPHPSWSTAGTWNAIRGWFGLAPAGTPPERTPPGPALPAPTAAPAPTDTAPEAPPTGTPPRGVRANNPGNLQPGGHEAVFASAEQGAEQAAELLRKYAAKGRDTIASIIGKWAPASAGNDVVSYMSDVAKRTGYGVEQHLNLNDPATLSNLLAAITHHEQGYEPYGSALYRDAAAKAINQQISQSNNTTINVQGTASANDTARLVQDGQQSVNANNARMLSGAVR